MIYIYDGTFYGLLTCVYEHYYKEKAKGVYSKFNYQCRLLEVEEHINTDVPKAEKVYNAIKKKLGYNFLKNIHYAFLSNDIEKDNCILKYIIIGFKQGAEIDNYHTHKDVYPMHKIMKRVGFEVHRFLGLLRFKDINHVLYAAIEPDHNIITLLAPHFADRLSHEKFIIHDKKRSLAIICQEGEWYETAYRIDQQLIDNNTDEFEQLWKKYFKTIAIEGRKNLKLQQAFVPLKYRKNIIEFSKKTME